MEKEEKKNEKRGHFVYFLIRKLEENVIITFSIFKTTKLPLHTEEINRNKIE